MSIEAKAKELINLPYNKFNLDNYFDRLLSERFAVDLHKPRSEDSPIKLMSGGHDNSGIVISESYHLHSKGRKIYLVGKGILFDSGGLNLKDKMQDMYLDKAGMITALAVAKEVGINVVAYCPVSANFIHSSKITPGDVLTIGEKEVKVTDTDAEGRIILAEALSKLEPGPNDIVITIATLTGAVEYAIGERATGVFSIDGLSPKGLGYKYLQSAEATKELSWPLPMWDYIDKGYKKEKQLKNWHKQHKCGATEAAMFLLQFVKYPHNFLHLDIASSSVDRSGKASGVPIKSLIHFIRRLNG